jgi:hypothetical protein
MSTDKPVDLRAYRKMQISATGLMASTVMYTLFLIFLLWWMSAKVCCGPREKRNDGFEETVSVVVWDVGVDAGNVCI